MAIGTLIQWTDSTVNPTMGCDGCELWKGSKKCEKSAISQAEKDGRSCYAGILHAKRGGKNRGYAKDFHKPECFPGRMAAAAKYPDLWGLCRLHKPWLNGLPRLLFVSDLSDALSRTITFEYLHAEIITVAASPQGRHHQWLWLSKRPKRMAEFSRWLDAREIAWPQNLWAGVSITRCDRDAKIENERLADILGVGSHDTIRFLSVEPQFGPAVIPAEILKKLDWVIQGGGSAQSRKNAHPFDLSWAYDLKKQCEEAKTPYFLKQLGSNVLVDGKRLFDSHGGDWSEWPADLRVRQMPIYAGEARDGRIRQRKVG